MLRYGWQTDRDVWLKISASLHDASWQYVDFAEIEATAVPEGVSGVYALCACPVGYRYSTNRSAGQLLANLFTPIYIGKTKDLHRRFLEHCRRPSGRVKLARDCFGVSMTFWFHRVPSDRIGYDEAVLIKCFGPTGNDRDESITASLGNPVPIGIHT